MNLFYDESGNTGTDLLNGDQPVFSLASTSLSENIARELIAPLIRPNQKEAKYSKLKGTRQGQVDIINFFNSPCLSVKNSKFTMADKKYYLITHIVDKLIEPTLYEHGVNLYENDAHVGLVNVWYYSGEMIFPGYWKKILQSFVHVIRQRDRSAYSQFDQLLSKAALNVPVENRDYATGLLLARGRLEDFIGVYKNIEVFDPAFDLFISLTHKWMEQSPTTFSITHDESKPLKRNEEFLRTLMTPLAPRIIGYGKRTAELPLRVLELEFGNSLNHPQLQVADIIAGAAIDCLMAWSGKKPIQDYHEALKGSQLGSLFCDGMLPSIDNIVKSNPSKPGEKNLVDGTTDFLKEAGYFK